MLLEFIGAGLVGYFFGDFLFRLLYNVLSLLLMLAVGVVVGATLSISIAAAVVGCVWLGSVLWSGIVHAIGLVGPAVHQGVLGAQWLASAALHGLQGVGAVLFTPAPLAIIGVALLLGVYYCSRPSRAPASEGNADARIPSHNLASNSADLAIACAPLAVASAPPFADIAQGGYDRDLLIATAPPVYYGYQ